MRSGTWLRGVRRYEGGHLLASHSTKGLKLDERARLGITLAWQEPARFEEISVREHLSTGNRGADPGQSRQRVNLAPGEYLDRMADQTLSGGEWKRLELAAVLGT